MNEEIRKPGAELSDAELAGVSGGYSDADYEKAKRLCALCHRFAPEDCDEGSVELLARIVNHIDEYFLCPYYEGDVG